MVQVFIRTADRDNMKFYNQKIFTQSRLISPLFLLLSVFSSYADNTCEDADCNTGTYIVTTESAVTTVNRSALNTECDRYQGLSAKGIDCKEVCESLKDDVNSVEGVERVHYESMFSNCKKQVRESDECDKYGNLEVHNGTSCSVICRNNVNDDTNTVLKECNKKLTYDSSSRSAGAECQNQCNQYVTSISGKEGVCSSINNIECNDICQRAPTDIPLAVEESINTDRNECLSRLKSTFKGTYITECLRYIKKKEKEKGSGVTLLCKESAKKVDTGCKEFCQAEVDKERGNLFSDSINPQEIVKYISDPSDDNIPLSWLVNNISLDDYKTRISHYANQAVAGQFNEGGEPIQPFSWWVVCERGRDRKQSCEADLELALEEAIETCAELQGEAYKCCHNAEKCVGGGLATALDGLGKLHVGMSAFRGAKEQCDAVKETFGLYAGMKGAMASQCTLKANSCQSGCRQEQEKVAKAFKEACRGSIKAKGDYNEAEHSCSQDFFNHYRKEYKETHTTQDNEREVNIAKAPGQCEVTGREANRSIQGMSTNMGTSLLASMRECGGEPEIEWDVPTQEVPKVAGPPVIPPPAPQAPPSMEIGGGGPDPRKRRRKSFDLPDDSPVSSSADPLGDEPDLGEAEKEDKSSPGGMSGLLGGSGGGTGGGLGGLGGGGGGSSGPGRRGSGGGSAKSKKILHGYAGGKFAGYGGGGSASGNSRGGYRRGVKRGKGGKRGLASLDLKKLLPKGKQLNHKVGKFGSPHDDIFQRMSHRVQWMCRTNKIPCK